MTKSIPTSRRVVRCSAGVHSFCFDYELLESVQGIENLYPSRGVDGSIGWIRRGDLKIPVFRLTDQLESRGRALMSQGVIAILRREDHTWALLVDKIGSSVEILYERIFPLPAVTGDGNGRFPWVVVDDQELDLYLAPERLVPAVVSGMDHEAPSTPPAPLPSNVRPTIARLSGQAPEERDMAAAQLITFTLEHRFSTPVRFALSAGQALEIISNPPLITIPRAPGFVKGLINWRSLPVPVVDLAAWLGMPVSREEIGRRLMICRGTIGRSKRDPGLVAISPVGDVKKLDLPVEYRSWQDPVKWNPALALGVYRFERGMMVVPDLDAILSFQGSISGPVN